MMCGADHATIATVQFVILLYNTPVITTRKKGNIHLSLILAPGLRMLNGTEHKSINFPMPTLGGHTPIFIHYNLHKERTKNSKFESVHTIMLHKECHTRNSLRFK